MNSRVTKENDLEKIFDAIEGVVIFKLSSEGNIEGFNSCCTDLLDYTTSELIGKHYSSLLINSLGDKNFLDTEKVSVALSLKNGSVIPCKLTHKKITLNNGSIGHYLILNKLNPDATIVSNSPIAMAMFDKNMRYISVSQKWIEDYKLENRNIIGESHYDIFPEIGEEWKKIHRECLEGKTNISDSQSFKRENGEVQWLKWEVKPWYTHDNKVGGLLMYTYEITKRVEIEKNLRLSEEQFRGAFKASPIGMAIVSLEGKWIRVNNKLTELLGYEREEFYKLTFQDITHPVDLEKDLSLLQKTLEGEINSYKMEKRYFHKNGQQITALLHVSLVRDENNQPVHFVSMIQDITQQNLFENSLQKSNNELKVLSQKLMEQNRRLLNFAHITSHNLRAPASNLKALIDLYKEEENEEVKEKIVENLSESVQNLNETLDQLMLSIKVQRDGKRQIEPVNIKDTINKVVRNISNELASEKITIHQNLDAFETIQYNKVYLESIFQNLISNAIKYQSPDRDLVIKITTMFREDEKTIIIEDNGLGIDLEKHGHKVFGLYKTFHRHKEARGVGLFITKTHVEAMGGKIKIESIPKMGTKFYIVL